MRKGGRVAGSASQARNSTITHYASRTAMNTSKRILFVFSWLVVGGEETEVRLLARNLDPARYRLEVVPCFKKPEMPDLTHEQLEALGVPVDRTPYTLTFEE